MASIRSRTTSSGDVTHTVLWRHDGKQRGLTFVDIASADRFRSNIERFGADEALAILDITDSSDELTLTQWLTDYVESLSGIGEHTRKQYKRYAEHDLAELGTLPLPAITEAAVKKWLRGMESATSGKGGRKPSGKTIQNKHAFLSGAMKAAVRAGKIDKNPCEYQRIKRTERREMVMLSRNEFDQIHAAIERQLWADLALWLVSTGMRFSEATAIRASDIDQNAGTCRISRAWKRGVDGWEVGPPKTRRSVRTINLPRQALDVAARRAEDGGEYLFVNGAGSPVRQQNFFNEAWNPARKVLVGKVPRIHDLRHTCASWMIASGVPLVVVSRHLGHEDITTTANVYSHADRSSFEKAAIAISDLLD